MSIISDAHKKDGETHLGDLIYASFVDGRTVLRTLPWDDGPNDEYFTLDQKTFMALINFLFEHLKIEGRAQ